MLIRTNSILKLDLIFTGTITNDNISTANSTMDTNIIIIKTRTTIVNGYDLIQRYMTNKNMEAMKNKNDTQPAAIILSHDKKGSSSICCIDQDEAGEEDETQAQSTSISSSSDSITSKTTITKCLGIHQYASSNCNNAAYALMEEERVPYQGDDDNEDDNDWMIQDAADSDAAHHNVDQGSFVSSMNLNQQQSHTDDDDDDDDDEDDDNDSIHLSKQRQEEEWFKGTLFYEDPGTAPALPPKDYISINNFIDFDNDEHNSNKKVYHRDIQSMYNQQQQPSSSPSLYSLAFSTSKIGTSIKSRRRTITGKVRNAFKRKSIFSRA